MHIIRLPTPKHLLLFNRRHLSMLVCMSILRPWWQFFDRMCLTIIQLLVIFLNFCIHVYLFLYMWICTICRLIKILKVCFVVWNWRVVFTSIDVFACLMYIFLLYLFLCPFPKFHAHTHFKQFSNTTILNFFWYFPSSIYMIRLTAGMDGIPGLFIHQICNW